MGGGGGGGSGVMSVMKPIYRYTKLTLSCLITGMGVRVTDINPSLYSYI